MDKHLFRVITIIVLLCVGSVGYVTAKERKAWSAEVSEPGMGLPDDEADYLEQLWNSGMSDEEIQKAMCERFDDINENFNEPTTQQTTNQAPATETPSTTKSTTTEAPKAVTKTTTQTNPVKVYEHDFDTITDEAKDNFIHFSEDGAPDSMYLNIRAESAMNTITGRELNATTSGNEVGTINYVDAEGNVLRSWVFENWKSDDDFYLDLTAYLEPYASEELVAAYKLSLQDVTLPEGNAVVLKVQSPYADGTVVNIFTEETGELKETGKTLTVADGYITFEFTDVIATPIMSPETLAPVSTSEVKEDVSKDAVAAEAAPAEAVNEAVLEAETPDPALSSKTETVQNNNTKYIIGIICAVLVVAAGVFAVNNKKRAKAA